MGLAGQGMARQTRQGYVEDWIGTSGLGWADKAGPGGDRNGLVWHGRRGPDRRYAASSDAWRKRNLERCNAVQAGRRRLVMAKEYPAHLQQSRADLYDLNSAIRKAIGCL